MRVAIVAFYFPPDGGAGTQRPAAWARHFPACGIEATVFARRVARSGDRNRFEPEDASFADWIGGANVERIVWTGEPGGGKAWIVGLEAALAAAHARRPFDLLLVTVPPFELASWAGPVAARLRVPLVLDLRDVWALDGVRPMLPWKLRRELARMRTALSAASALVTTAPDASAAMSRLVGPSIPVATVTNGFEPADFAGPPPARHDGEFRLVFAGSFLSDDAVPGRGLKARIKRLLASRAVDIRPTGRSPLHLLGAIRRLRERGDPLAARIRFHFAGVVDPATRAVIDASGVADIVTCHGYVPHAETVGLMRSADALFIGLHGMPPGERPLLIPGKVFECLAARRPILAALPPGDARELVLAHGDAVAVDPCDDEAIAVGLARIAAGDLDAREGGGDLTPFTRAALARALAAFLHATLDRLRATGTMRK